MVAPSFKERVRQTKISLREWFFMLQLRPGIPKSWYSGGYSRIKFVRFSMVVLALLSYSALSLGTNFTAATFLNLWYGLIAAGYVIVAIVYLLGLRMWYAPSTLFLIISALINLALNFSGGPLGLGPAATLAFAVVVGIFWLYLVIAGLFMLRYDKGSKINEMLLQS